MDPDLEVTYKKNLHKFYELTIKYHGRWFKKVLSEADIKTSFISIEELGDILQILKKKRMSENLEISKEYFYVPQANCLHFYLTCAFHKGGNKRSIEENFSFVVFGCDQESGLSPSPNSSEKSFDNSPQNASPPNMSRHSDDMKIHVSPSALQSIAVIDTDSLSATKKTVEPNRLIHQLLTTFQNENIFLKQEYQRTVSSLQHQNLFLHRKLNTTKYDTLYKVSCCLGIPLETLLKKMDDFFKHDDLVYDGTITSHDFILSNFSGNIPTKEKTSLFDSGVEEVELFKHDTN